MHPESRSNGAVAERRATPALDDPAFLRLPQRPPSRRLLGRTRLAILIGLVAIAVVGTFAYQISRGTDAPAAAPAEVVRPAARGEVVPVARARVGSVDGGQVTQINVAPGDHVEAQQPIGRVNGHDGLEVVFAPWPATVTGVLVRAGDTITPGTIMATLGDVSRLQVETTDVDEFLIGRISRGTSVRLMVDAIGGSQINGVVRQIAVEPQTNANGDRQYPATIDLVDPPPSLRPGMTVRVYLGP